MKLRNFEDLTLGQRETLPGSHTLSEADRGLLTLDGELQRQAGKVVLKFRSLMLIYRRPPIKTPE